MIQNYGLILFKTFKTNPVA